MSDTPRTDAAFSTGGFALLSLCKSYERENAIMREDKARLDWLEKQGADIHCNPKGRWTIWAYGQQHEDGPTARAVIDAARRNR